MASPLSVKIQEICQVAPAFSSPELATEVSLPLTFLDIWWLRFPPVERVFFYQLPDLTPSFFNSVILPGLKKSLSQTLLHFLPLAGHIIWPSSSPLPVLSYILSDAVLFTVAESNADLDRLSSNEIREAMESRPYIPELPISETKASMIALQVTLFPNKGFSIGIINHHAILDGKSTTMFIKAWAYMCMHIEGDQAPLLPDELTPVFDRTVVRAAPGLDMLYLDTWSDLSTRLNMNIHPRSLNVWQSFVGQPNLARATFVLTRDNIKTLRERVVSQLLDKNAVEEKTKPTKLIYLSSFTLTCAYTLVCMVKAVGGNSDRNVYFAWSADCRSRLDPPIPENYFGNCINVQYFVTEASRLLQDENAVAIVAERISGMIKGLETKFVYEGAEQALITFACKEPEGQAVSVAGSPRFGVYGSDFGWGRPMKVEITSTDRTGAIALAESRDEAGGVEIGLVLAGQEMEVFASLFHNGLKDPL